MPEATRFDLTSEPWIPVRFDDGVRELSLRGAFREAGRARAVVGELPTTGFALTRLLVAILYAAVRDAAAESPIETWRHVWGGGTSLAEITDPYLDDWAHRFDLLHPSEPFYQVAGLRTAKGEVSGLEKLIADVPNGRPFFTTRLGRGTARISLAEGARWVVHAQAFDSSGIKSGAVGDERVKGGKGYPIGTAWAGSLGGVLVEGSTLRETLALNLVLGDPGTGHAVDREDDLPVWERDVLPGPGIRRLPSGAPWAPTGPLDVLTWQSRRIRIAVDGDEVTGVVLANGDPLAPQNRFDVEWMTAWRRSEPQEKRLGLERVYMPRTHDPSRALWRGLAALLPQASQRERIAKGDPALAPATLDWLAVLTGHGALDDGAPVRTHAIGIEYGPQSSTVAEIVDDAIVFSAVLLGAHGAELRLTALSAVERSERAVLALANLAGNLAVAAGGESAGSRERARELGYFALDAPFRRWLSGIRPHTDPAAALEAWSAQAGALLLSLGTQAVEAAGPAAWVGRERDGRHVSAAEAHAWFVSAIARELARPDRDESRPDAVAASATAASISEAEAREDEMEGGPR